MSASPVENHSLRGSSFPRQRVLAHRGLWTSSVSGNDRRALEAAVEAGLGIETDIRDAAAGICVSHDPPESARVLPMADLLGMWSAATSDPGILALNVKSDGLVPLLLEADRDWTALDCFFFDMSVPELLQYARVGLPVAVRLSEFETWDQALVNALHQRPSVWLDSFTCDWFIGKHRSLLSSRLRSGVRSWQPRADGHQGARTRPNGRSHARLRRRSPLRAKLSLLAHEDLHHLPRTLMGDERDCVRESEQ